MSFLNNMDHGGSADSCGGGNRVPMFDTTMVFPDGNAFAAGTCASGHWSWNLTDSSFDTTCGGCLGDPDASFDGTCDTFPQCAFSACDNLVVAGDGDSDRDRDSPTCTDCVCGTGPGEFPTYPSTPKEDTINPHVLSNIPRRISRVGG